MHRDVRGGARVECTMLMVMHKVPVMRMCNWVVLVYEGVVGEQGS